ncbi:replication-associated recombination protein A [Candidatus Nitrospira allomarina]|uniref:Replication-associated recombination protein A n=1 Tax=Candidatus Nitrospira allomarina TaxID=3020900 RepID=A0AA96GAX5_9BACT|nr:replication-associated recombination protein A [Candidatus Nitrospira allomarina]WNM58433.1 replication-associated recombination protein A [Candidatus Nitrospira allomarina]
MESFESQSQEDLFPAQEASDTRPTPLAERMRPLDFDEFVGQEDVLAQDQPLRVAIEHDRVPSLILWGPPGTGKTTLASLIAKKTQATFVPFSAVLSGVPELRGLLKTAQQRRKVSGQRTLLFVDEIHRFNKAQQDAFLPYVERGDIILIGATTQNPSFEVIAPLLSRSMVVVLQSLNEEALRHILNRALSDTKRGLGSSHVTLTPAAQRLLIGYGNGDARSMLTGLEFVVGQYAKPGKPTTIDQPHVEQSLKQKALRYDRDGEEHYNLISAFIKSMRDSDPDGALYWLARMLEGGEEPKFIARRMMIFASEDIGMADPQGLLIASAVFHAVEVIGLSEAQINLAHGVTYLATAPKSNASYMGLLAARRDAKEKGNLPVPLHLRNAVTSLMKDLDYGKDYRYAHDDPKGAKAQTHLPKELEDRRYYRPSDSATASPVDEEEDLNSPW